MPPIYFTVTQCPHPCLANASSTVSSVENGLSLLSYQLCSYPVTRNVQRLQAVQTSHTAYVHCGAWIPWKKCPKTVYQTQYLAVEVPESRNVTDCCEGFEQLGFYCVLRESGAMGQGGAWSRREELLGLCVQACEVSLNY